PNVCLPVSSSRNSREEHLTLAERAVSAKGRVDAGCRLRCPASALRFLQVSNGRIKGHICPHLTMFSKTSFDTSRIQDQLLCVEEQRRSANGLKWRRGVEPEDKASLRILVQNDKKESIFSITFVSNRPYEAALQEAIGLGQRLLKNETHAARVEIRDEHMHSRKPL